MKKLKIGDIEKIRDKVKKTANLRKNQSRAIITVHMGTCGKAAGAEDILNAVINQLNRHKIGDVIIKTSGCAGFCSREPMITVEVKGEPPVKYGDLTEQRIDKIISQHIIQGNLVKEFVLALGSERTY
ncbi:MAG: (2Fe-2S) ferredoxin domain-containing protein [bacterium]